MNDEVQKEVDDNSSDRQEEAPSHLTLGQRLKAEREKLEVTWEDVYQDTRIPVAYLEALENDDFENMPSEGVLKGFVRNYSKFLKLDPDEIIGELSETDPLKEELIPVSFGKSVNRGFFRDMQGGAIIIGLAIFALVILITAGAIWWFGTNQGERPSNETAGPTGQVEEAQPTLSEDVDTETMATTEFETPTSQESADPIDEPPLGSITDQETSSPLDSSIPSQDQAEIGEEGELFNDPTRSDPSIFPLTDSESDSPEDVISQGSADSSQLDSQQETEVPTEEASHDLEFTFEDISWVQVTDGSGKVLVNGVQEANTELNLDGEAPFDIRLGKASGVKLLYRGEEVALGQYTRRNDAAVFTLQP